MCSDDVLIDPHDYVLFVAAFTAIQGNLAALQKLVFCLGNGAAVLLAVYKCQSMGLLPTHASDWLAFEQPQMVSAIAAIGTSFTCLLLLHHTTISGNSCI